jgi:hypothetical protein
MLWGGQKCPTAKICVPYLQYERATNSRAGGWPRAGWPIALRGFTASSRVRGAVPGLTFLPPGHYGCFDGARCALGVGSPETVQPQLHFTIGSGFHQNGPKFKKDLSPPLMCPSLRCAFFLLAVPLAGGKETILTHARAQPRTHPITEAEAKALALLRARVRGAVAAEPVDTQLSYWRTIEDEDFAVDPCTMRGVQCDKGHVTVISLRKSGLVGEIPSELRLLPKLTRLDLAHNSLDGPIPSWISEFRSLEKLNLAENSFSGAIPPSVGLLHQLDTLMLAGNQLSGEIPQELGLLSRLTTLSVSGNQLSGRIPSGIGSLPLRRADWRHTASLHKRELDSGDQDNEQLLCPEQWAAGRIPKADIDCTAVHDHGEL